MLLCSVRVYHAPLYSSHDGIYAERPVHIGDLGPQPLDLGQRLLCRRFALALPASRRLFPLPVLLWADEPAGVGDEGAELVVLGPQPLDLGAGRVQFAEARRPSAGGAMGRRVVVATVAHLSGHLIGLLIVTVPFLFRVKTTVPPTVSFIPSITDFGTFMYTWFLPWLFEFLTIAAAVPPTLSGALFVPILIFGIRPEAQSPNLIEAHFVLEIPR